MENHLRKIREEKGLTLREVADRAETSIQQIQRLEKGDRRLTTDWIERLADALGCSPSAIVPGLSHEDEWIQERKQRMAGLNEEERDLYDQQTETFWKMIEKFREMKK